MEKTICETGKTFIEEPGSFEEFTRSVKERFDAFSSENVVFKTDVGDLFEVYIDSLPEEARRYYNCNACKHFLRLYGGLVVIINDRTHPLMFGNISGENDFFCKTHNVLYDAVEKARVVSPFYAKSTFWEARHDGEWNHLGVIAPRKFTHHSRVETASQKMASKVEDFRILSRSAADFSVDTVSIAISVLESFSVDRIDEKFLPVAKKFYQLVLGLSSTKNRVKKDNIKWLYVGTNNPGDCHIRSGVIGTLLEDIECGDFSLDQIKDRFEDKTDCTNYMRPTTLKTGNVDVANDIIKKLGMENSFKRSFATLDEVETMWVTKLNIDTKKEGSGLFDSLKEKKHKKLESSKQKDITYRKFASDILPEAERIKISCSHGNFCAITSATDTDAPLLYRYGNCLSNYVYRGGSNASRWNTEPGFRNVTAITKMPDGKRNAALFVIENCKDTSPEGLAIFPELLIHELHKIRHTVEAFSREGNLSGFDEASACGLLMEGNNPVVIKVEKNNVVSTYRIDRFE